MNAKEAKIIVLKKKLDNKDFYDQIIKDIKAAAEDENIKLEVDVTSLSRDDFFLICNILSLHEYQRYSTVHNKRIDKLTICW